MKLHRTTRILSKDWIFRAALCLRRYSSSLYLHPQAVWIRFADAFSRRRLSLTFHARNFCICLCIVVADSCFFKNLHWSICFSNLGHMSSTLWVVKHVIFSNDQKRSNSRNTYLFLFSSSRNNVCDPIEDRFVRLKIIFSGSSRPTHRSWSMT